MTTIREMRGISLPELLVALALGAMMLAVALPAAAHLRSSGRVAAGARIVAGMFAEQRFKSIALHNTRGYSFELLPTGWAWREVEDGNGNGLRTAEVRSRVDRTVHPPRRLEEDVEHVVFGIPPGGPYPEAPPGTGTITEGDDPVRFGTSDLVSFTPLGRASSGTVYLTDGADGLCAVVLFGATARTRVWRWDRGAGQWTR